MAGAMTDGLEAQGVLDPAWRAAFTEVPRHVFVPMFYNHDGSTVVRGHPEQHEEWMAAVYRDESLTTQQVTMPGTGLVVPTSSSTRPSLMARMLGLLDVADGQSVLEIGTGTGYNAALLSHRLGAGRVASIDIDRTLVESAAAALKEVGFEPRLRTGDGASGLPDLAPFDRVIATCAVPRVPVAWVDQLADRGVIVTDIRAETSTALATLTKVGPDTALGRFHAVPGHFMWLRAEASNPLRNGAFDFVFDVRGARESHTALDPSILDDPNFGFALALHMPDITGSYRRLDPDVRILRTADGSWAQVEVATHRTTQAGSRSVWDEVEGAARQWSTLGRPQRSRFGLTVTSHSGQHIWLDHPDNRIPG